jgi:hypothetical protein
MDSKYAGYFQGMEGSPFSEEEKIEKDLLLEKGFLNWDRRDYQRFIQAIELYPRSNPELIA